MFKEAFVAIDGSKFKAVNNRDKNFTKAKLKRRLEQIDESIERYLGQIASADRQESDVAQDRTQRLEDKIAALKEGMTRLRKLEVEMLKVEDQQLSITDPDARSMNHRGGGIVGYNVQTAVDSENHLIVAHEVTNRGSDRHQLANMAKQAKEAIGSKKLEAVADRGYYEGEELRACEDHGIATYVPRPQTSNNQARGLYGKRDFIYQPEEDEYECPAGERLIYRFTRVENDKTLRRYWSSACPHCPIKSQCTTGDYRRVSRWEHEKVLDAVQGASGQRTGTDACSARDG